MKTKERGTLRLLVLVQVPSTSTEYIRAKPKGQNSSSDVHYQVLVPNFRTRTLLCDKNSKCKRKKSETWTRHMRGKKQIRVVSKNQMRSSRSMSCFSLSIAKYKWYKIDPSPQTSKRGEINKIL